MIKLISLNIEGDNHIDKDRFLPFLVKENPDIFCLQEVFEDDISRITKETEMECVGFYPMCFQKSWIAKEREPRPIGVALFSRVSHIETFSHYYVGTADHIPVFAKPADTNVEPNKINLVVGGVTIVVDDKQYTFCTTHFTWTPDGESRPYQKVQQESLLAVLKTIPAFILCGDFNAPRGKEIFSEFAKYYKDNIPPQYISSIDPVLHRRLGLTLMVDGLFSTPEYIIENVSLVEGVSDHKAIVAYIK